MILLTASYDDREFVRVGFYNNNEYSDPAKREEYDTLLANGTDEAKAAWKFEGVKNVEIQRNILTAKPRVTRFNIKWDNENFNDEPPVQEEADLEDVVELEDLGEGEDQGDEEVEVEEEGEPSNAAAMEVDTPEEGAEEGSAEEDEEELDSEDDDEDDAEEEGGEAVDEVEAETAAAAIVT